MEDGITIYPCDCMKYVFSFPFLFTILIWMMLRLIEKVRKELLPPELFYLKLVSSSHGIDFLKGVKVYVYTLISLIGIVFHVK